MPIPSLNSVPILTLAHLVTGRLHPASVSDNQWDLLVNLALDHGLGGMLLWSLRKAGWTCDTESRWQPLIKATCNNGRHNLYIEKAHRQAVAAFDRANVPAIWLKGILLAHTFYPEPYLRPMADLDVLVPREHMADALQALEALGFRPAEIDFFEMGGFTDKARHHECLVDRSGQVKLELHFRLLVPSLYYEMNERDLSWFWTQTQKMCKGGLSFQALKTEANLLHLCGHAILQNYGKDLDLLHLFDLHLLISHGTLDWKLVLEQAVKLRWTYAVETALSMLPNLFGTHLPEGILHALREQRPVDEITINFMDSLSVNLRWDEWRQAFRHMTLYERTRLVWMTLFPPGTFLRQRYRLSPRQSLYKYYVLHFLDGIHEAAQSLFQGHSNPKESSIHNEDTA